MKTAKYFLLFITVIVFWSCIKNSEPTSPDTQKISLKKENDSVVISLKHNQKAIINNELKLSFDSVSADSRCPENANCVWEGDGAPKFVLTNKEESRSVILHTSLGPHTVNFYGYQIILKSLNPHPSTNSKINQEEYSVDLLIKYSSTDNIKPVQLIEGNDDSIIKRDMLNVNGVKLNKDTLTFDVNFGGGCKEHDINLFAYKAIQESNPAQVTVMMSHNADNDACKALIRREVNFNLSGLKEYLKNNFNIQDKAILLLFDPSGRPLRNPYVEYVF